MIDGATLGGLNAGYTDWNAVRALKEHALNQQQQIANIHQQDLRDNEMASAKIQEYLNAIDKAGLLDPDHKKVQAKELELRGTIADGIKKFGGDVDAYLNSGGLTELHDYLHDLTNSDEMKTGLMNYYHHNRYLTDKNAGLVTRNTGYGNTGTYEENYQDYLKGKTPTLNYKGGFERPAIDLRQEIGKSYGNAYKTPQAANYYDAHNAVFTAAKAKGMSDADANQIALEYAGVYSKSMEKGLAPYQFKSEDPLDAELKRSRIALNHSKTKGINQMLSNGDFLDNVNNGMIDPHKSQPYANGFLENQYNLPAHYIGAAANAAGYEIDPKTGIVSNPEVAQANNNLTIAGTDKKLDLSKLTPGVDYKLEPGSQYVRTSKPSAKGGYDEVHQGVRMRVALTPQGMEKLGVASSWGGKQDNTPGLTYHSGPWYRFGDTGAEGVYDVVAPFQSGYDEHGKAIIAPQMHHDFQKNTDDIQKQTRAIYGGDIDENILQN